MLSSLVMELMEYSKNTITVSHRYEAVIFILLLFCVDHKHYAKRTIIEARTSNFECANLLRRFNMLSDTWADVIVADADKKQRLAGILREFIELYALEDIVSCYKFVGDRQVHRNEFVHLALYLSNLLCCRAFGEIVVYL